MPIAKNLFDWDQRQFIVLIKLYYSYSYGYHQKMKKIKRQKIDGIFVYLSVNLCRIIHKNFIRFLE